MFEYTAWRFVLGWAVACYFSPYIWFFNSHLSECLKVPNRFSKVDIPRFMKKVEIYKGRKVWVRLYYLVHCTGVVWTIPNLLIRMNLDCFPKISLKERKNINFFGVRQ